MEKIVNRTLIQLTATEIGKGAKLTQPPISSGPEDDLLPALGFKSLQFSIHLCLPYRKTKLTGNRLEKSLKYYFLRTDLLIVSYLKRYQKLLICQALWYFVKWKARGRKRSFFLKFFPRTSKLCRLSYHCKSYCYIMKV